MSDQQSMFPGRAEQIDLLTGKAVIDATHGPKAPPRVLMNIDDAGDHWLTNA